MPGDAGEAVFKLTLDKSQFDQGMAKAQSTAGKLGGKLGKLVKMGGLAAAGGLAVAGVAAVKFAADFDSAYNTIRVGTGATGEALEGLKDDFRSAFADVPADMQDVAMATADLNTRLGHTGEPLQQLTKQFLELSRITKTDLGTNITTVTRVFGDWGIATEDQSEALDKLFRVSQMTGPSVDEIGRLVVAYGAPLRQFGFSFEEAALLMGRFQKEGVNTELVMGSLRIAMGKFAKEGRPLRQALDETVAKIQELGPGAEATALAMEVFGARAGPDMAATILEGKFSIDELMGTFEESTDTIIGVGKETMTLGDRFTLLKNKVLVALEPYLRKLFDMLERALERVTPWLEKNLPIAIAKMKRAWEDIRPVVEAFVKHFRRGMETVMPVVQRLVKFILKHKPLLVAAIAAIGVAIVVALGPGAVAIAAIVGLITVIGYLRDNWREVADFIVGKAQWLKDQVLRPITWLKDMLAQHWREIVTVALAILFPPGAGLFALVTNSFGIRDKIVGAFKAVPGLLRELASEFLSAALGLGEDLATGIKDGLLKFGGFVGEIKDAFIGAIKGGWNAMIDWADRTIKVSLKKSAFGKEVGFEWDPDFSKFKLHEGGVVPGRPGDEVMALLEAGERVLPVGTTTNNAVSVGISVSGGFGDFESMKRAVLRAVEKRLDEEAAGAGLRSPLIVHGVGIGRV